MTWTFDRFEPGKAIGTAEQTVDDAKVDAWYAIYSDQPDTRPLVPAGMAMLIVMHGYAEAVQPRPNGNVHASQELTIKRLPRIGDRLTTSVRCKSKQLKKERRWVTFDVEVRDQHGNLCYEATNTSVWAA